MNTTLTPLTSSRNGPLKGRVRVPGDKSISHRALILGAMAVGETRISGLLEGEDVINTGKVVAALGASVERSGNGEWRVHGVGVGGFAEPNSVLDFGNSGTGFRLMLGAVAGCPVTATFDGDASLRRRPMRRVLEPLERIGARTLVAGEGRAADDACRRPRPDTDRVRAAGGLGAAEIGGAARRPCGAGRDRRDRARGDARSHRENARPFRRGAARRAQRRAWPPHHAHGPAGTGAAAGRGAGRSVVGGVSAGRGPDRAGLGRDPRRRDAESAAHRPFHHAARDGRRDRDAGRPQRRRGGRRRPPRSRRRAARRRSAGGARAVDDRRISGARGRRRRSPRATTRMRGLEGIAGQGIRPARSHRRDAAGQRRRGRNRRRRFDRARARPRPGRRSGRDPHGSSHRDVGAGDGTGKREAGSESTTARSSRPAFRISPA